MRDGPVHVDLLVSDCIDTSGGRQLPTTDAA